MAPDQVPPNNFPNTLVNCAIRQYARGMTTSPETQHDELDRIICDEVQDGLRGYDAPMPYVEISVAASAILAAGYRKPRTIETAAELDALPFESVITDAYGTPYVCERHRIDGTGNEWIAAGTSYLQESQYVLEHGDVTVHYTPEPSA